MAPAHVPACQVIKAQLADGSTYVLFYVFGRCRYVHGRGDVLPSQEARGRLLSGRC